MLLGRCVDIKLAEVTWTTLGIITRANIPELARDRGTEVDEMKFQQSINEQVRPNNSEEGDGKIQISGDIWIG